jgi:DNA-binding NtrC family response regulator
MLRASSVPFSAVISDLTMPHLNGIVLFAEIRKAFPLLPVLLSSGYSGSLTTESARAAGFAGLLQKPYSFEDLAAAIGRAMHDSRV